MPTPNVEKGFEGLMVVQGYSQVFAREGCQLMTRIVEAASRASSKQSMGDTKNLTKLFATLTCLKKARKLRNVRNSVLSGCRDDGILCVKRDTSRLGVQCQTPKQSVVLARSSFGVLMTSKNIGGHETYSTQSLMVPNRRSRLAVDHHHRIGHRGELPSTRGTLAQTPLNRSTFKVSAQLTELNACPMSSFSIACGGIYRLLN